VNINNQQNQRFSFLTLKKNQKSFWGVANPPKPTNALWLFLFKLLLPPS